MDGEMYDFLSIHLCYFCKLDSYYFIGFEALRQYNLGGVHNNYNIILRINRKSLLYNFEKN